MASLYGAIPFGTRERGRTKVNHLSNLEGKTLLHQYDLFWPECSPEMKSYFERTLELVNSKMSIFKIIMNNLMARAFG